ncbi:MAG: type II toxin-antitoxin system HicA family toxin [Candidatus Peribacteria bacterium]|jgi:predicted RNA binding protein YcfA (HicA-like mRNA interferase family)|nr:type II toxin-antitoxin system HicA family toxin [Candidatus Peribacteria bacterium]
MPLRNSFTYRDLVKVLKHFGCYLGEQGKGSHETRYSPITGCTFTIFYHAGATFKVKTLFSILEDAGISKQDVIHYLNKK